MMTRALLLGLLVTLSGCSNVESLPQVESSQDLELGPLLPADAVLVGVAQTPDARLFVLDQRSGLYEVTGSSASLFFNTTGLSGVELTDVVALDSGRLALTAENDGFLLDLNTRELTSYFCYLPAVPEMPPAGTGGSPSFGGAASTGSTEPVVSVSQTLQLDGVAVKQRTESVAYNYGTQQLFAQPQTFRLDTGGVAGSELFTFAASGGEPIRVQPFADASFVAGGMAASADDRLLVGAGRQLYEVLWSGNLKHVKELDGSVEITGMSPAREGLASATGGPQWPGISLWILDGAGRRLLALSNL